MQCDWLNSEGKHILNYDGEAHLGQLQRALLFDLFFPAGWLSSWLQDAKSQGA